MCVRMQIDGAAGAKGRRKFAKLGFLLSRAEQTARRDRGRGALIDAPRPCRYIRPPINSGAVSSARVYDTSRPEFTVGVVGSKTVKLAPSTLPPSRQQRLLVRNRQEKVITRGVMTSEPVRRVTPSKEGVYGNV